MVPQQNTCGGVGEDHQMGNARGAWEWEDGWKHKPRQCRFFPRGQRVSLASTNLFGEEIFQKFYVDIPFPQNAIRGG